MASAEVRIRTSDVPMNGMKQGENGDAKALFVRDAAGVRAFEAQCPHYGAPLAKGALCDGILYCPWHKAAFDVGTGALKEPPALHGLKQYQVRTEGDETVATLEALAPETAAKVLANKRVVIVGTGAAAVAAVVTLRREGFGGRIVMIGREGLQPYDRPNLSKNFLAKKTPASAAFLEKDFYAAHEVEVIGSAATRVDPRARRVTVEAGQTISGDFLLVATGSRAIVPDFPGKTLKNVFTLRSLADAAAISDAAEAAKRIVVVGGGFIGLESAAFLTKRGLQATVVAPEALPLAKRFGEDVARAIKVQHESKGIRFVTGDVAEFAGEGAVDAVYLKDGEVVEADMVLIGAGAAPETGVFDGVAKRDDGGIEVDARLQLAPHCWLAGDIAAFPEKRSGTIARIEHWRLAEQHGTHVARAILGSEAPFEAAPFFWSNQGEKRLDHVGYAPSWDRIIMRGDVKKLDFIAYYISGGRALAASAVGHNPAVMDFLHRLDRGDVPRETELEDRRAA